MEEFGWPYSNVSIDVWFWRAASLPVWERIRLAPDSYNNLVGETWEFAWIEGQERVRMSLNHEGEVRDEASWPALYQWLGEKLSLVYERVAPKLREAMEPGDAA